MNDQPRSRGALDVVLIVLWVLALVGLIIDLIDGEWLKTFSSLFLFIGLGASIQWRRFRSRRWRTVAWICFVLAFAALLFRLGVWAEWITM